MGINVASGAEKIEKAGRSLTVGSLIGYAASELLVLPPFIGTFFSYLLGVGVLTLGVGYTARKAAE